jgi:hypothetical protein
MLQQSMKQINTPTKYNKSTKLTNRAICFILTAITSAILQPFASTPRAHANPSESRRRPIKIDVEKVKITDEDIDKAIKLCLAKEGMLDPKSTKNTHPTAAQAFVMATICEQQ